MALVKDNDCVSCETCVNCGHGNYEYIECDECGNDCSEKYYEFNSLELCPNCMKIEVISHDTNVSIDEYADTDEESYIADGERVDVEGLMEYIDRIYGYKRI